MVSSRVTVVFLRCRRRPPRRRPAPRGRLRLQPVPTWLPGPDRGTRRDARESVESISVAVPDAQGLAGIASARLARPGAVLRLRDGAAGYLGLGARVGIRHRRESEPDQRGAGERRQAAADALNAGEVSAAST